MYKFYQLSTAPHVPKCVYFQQHTTLFICTKVGMRKLFYFIYQGKILFGLLFVFDPFSIQIVAVLLKLIHTLKISKDSRARKQWFSTSESFETILMLSLNY